MKLTRLTNVQKKDADAPAPASFSTSIKKADAELQVVWGEVFAPGLPDSQGDWMTAEDIRLMMWKFMKSDRLKKIDSQHNQIDNGCQVIECFQAREGDPDFIPGSWVLGVWCPDEVWTGVKSGDYNGFSLDGVGVRVDTVIEIEYPEEMTGETTEVAGHCHQFVVKFDEDGAYLGGETGPGGTDGHRHVIIKGAATEKTNGHNHRFSYVEGVLQANG